MDILRNKLSPDQRQNRARIQVGSGLSDLPGETRFQNMTPKTFYFRQHQIHRTHKREPVGLRVVETRPRKADGKVRVRRPIVMEWGASGGNRSWVERLSRQHGMKSGAGLSKLLLMRRIDAVVTLRYGRPYQIILLKAPTDLWTGNVDGAAVRKAAASAKYKEYFGEITGLQLRPWAFSGTGHHLLLGGDSSPKDLIKLTGLGGLSKYQAAYEASIHQGDLKSGGVEISLEVSGGWLDTLSRKIRIHPGGEVTILNETSTWAEGHPGILAGRVFYSQVLMGEIIGASKISCLADRSGGSLGYYTWARYGYSAPIGELPHGDLSLPHPTVGGSFLELVGKGIFPPHIALEDGPSSVTMHDLMMTPGGRDWWREYGRSWSANFNLTPDENGGPSKGVQVLEAFLREQEEHHGPLREWGPGLTPSPKGETILTSGDEAAFDRAWERMRVRSVKELG